MLRMIRNKREAQIAFQTGLPPMKNLSGQSNSVAQAIANASQQRYLSRMFICICNAIKEDDVREVARHGVVDPEEVYAVLGKTPQCRVCLDHAEDVIFDEQARCAGRCPARTLSAPAAGGFATA